jgi:pimeloyl-ACP methyl ester carboxylesterase
MLGLRTASLYWADMASTKRFVPESYEDWGYSRDQLEPNMGVVEALHVQGLFTDYSILERAATVCAPTLITGGRHDRIVTVQQIAALAVRLPHCRVEILEHSAHFPHIEEPERVRDMVLEYLCSIG